MKTSFKSKVAFLFVLIGLSFSCKKNDTIPAENTYVDSTETTVDTVSTSVDTATVVPDSAAIKTDTVGKMK
ncbi:hypothetical protein KHA90_14060 [Flavobacterium psychroterrae]|uniref:Cytochrome C551 n=1 Tax=Flavobacterium psychroterrae TaxID=2133767 RepID=A0ABS5PCZ1_9FLAO|nr:hypothetical protein [Flavobacterium psychroterrae]MBS7232151.1 hypothetical protein [Flavobacterium psychroterrae]